VNLTGYVTVNADEQSLTINIPNRSPFTVPAFCLTKVVSLVVLVYHSSLHCLTRGRIVA